MAETVKPKFSIFASIAKAAEPIAGERPRVVIAEPPRNAGRRGRKCAITPAIIDKVCEAIADGAYAWVAARAAGISIPSYHAWMRRGRDPDETDPIFAEFVDRVEIAQAAARVLVERRVSIDHPLAWLTRGPGREEGDPERPGWLNEKSSVEITGKNGGPIAHAHLHALAGKLDLSKLSDGELDELENLSRKALPSPARNDPERDPDREGEEEDPES